MNLSKRIITLLICLALIIILAISVSADTYGRSFDVGNSTAGASLEYYDAAGGAYATAATWINRAQLCSVSVSVVGNYYVPSTSDSIISTYASKSIGNGNGGQNSCSTSITAPGDMWISVSSTHTGRYDGNSKTICLP